MRRAGASERARCGTRLLVQRQRARLRRVLRRPLPRLPLRHLVLQGRSVVEELLVRVAVAPHGCGRSAQTRWNAEIAPRGAYRGIIILAARRCCWENWIDWQNRLWRRRQRRSMTTASQPPRAVAWRSPPERLLAGADAAAGRLPVDLLHMCCSIKLCPQRKLPGFCRITLHSPRKPAAAAVAAKGRAQQAASSQEAVRESAIAPRMEMESAAA